jgi:putative Holliday junction resolvase
VKYLSIDYGQKRVGLAGSESGIVVEPLQIINLSNSKDNFRTVFDVVSRYKPEEIVVGLPVNEDQTEGQWAKEVRKFVAGLSVEFKDVKVGVENEYLTSVEAKARSGRKVKESIDDYAAAIILEQYLNSKNKSI